MKTIKEIEARLRTLTHQKILIEDEMRRLREQWKKAIRLGDEYDRELDE